MLVTKRLHAARILFLHDYHLPVVATVFRCTLLCLDILAMFWHLRRSRSWVSWQLTYVIFRYMPNVLKKRLLFSALVVTYIIIRAFWQVRGTQSMMTLKHRRGVLETHTIHLLEHGFIYADLLQCNVCLVSLFYVFLCGLSYYNFMAQSWLLACRVNFCTKCETCTLLRTKSREPGGWFHYSLLIHKTCLRVQIHVGPSPLQLLC
jgi:hypothetical protein